MTTLKFDADKLYGYKILRDSDNQRISLQSCVGAGEKIVQSSRHTPVTAKIGDKIGDKAGVKNGIEL